MNTIVDVKDFVSNDTEDDICMVETIQDTQQVVKDLSDRIYSHDMNEEYDVVRVYKDYAPMFGTSYFSKEEKPPKGFDRISILIPMYNETTKDLKRTLFDLHSCILEMNKIGAGFVNILLILDGWEVTHPSVKEYLGELYPGISDYLQKLEYTPDVIETYVLQKLKGNKPTYVNIDEDKRLKLTVLMKMDNRRKHNSHGWFLEAFAYEMQSDYIFLTDCGTRFDEKCLINLYRNITNDPKCSAITGRQRVMTRAQQDSDDGFRAFMYRSMQRYDYEASIASYLGAFSTFGMLPVIPGPCGLYRYPAICDVKARDALHEKYAGICGNDIESNTHTPKTDDDCIDVIDYYIQTVSLNPDETGMLLGSLLLAEDRILSYATVMKTKERYHTKYEQNSCFYFEAETEAQPFLQQRRRWINGTFAGYLWILQRIHLLFNSKMFWWNKLFLSILIFAQLMMFVVTAFGIAIMMVGIRYPLIVSLKLPQLHVELGIGVYLLMYVLFVYLHSSPKNPLKLNAILFDLITVVNVLVVCVMMYGFAMNFFDLSKIDNVAVIAFNMIMPFILAALHDWKSLFLMFTSVIQYILLLPTFTVWLSIYSFSRLWELTWGNRPSDKLKTIHKKKSEREMQLIKTQLQTSAQTIAWMLVVLNILANFAFMFLQNNKYFIIGMQIFIFSWSSFQIVFSLFYFIVKLIMAMGTFVARLLCACSTSRKCAEVKVKRRTIEDFEVVVQGTHKEMIGSKM